MIKTYKQWMQTMYESVQALNEEANPKADVSQFLVNTMNSLQNLRLDRENLLKLLILNGHRQQMLPAKNLENVEEISLEIGHYLDSRIC